MKNLPITCVDLNKESFSDPVLQKMILESYKFLYDHIWSETEPEYFGSHEKVREFVEFAEFGFVPIKDVGYQTYRSGGRNSEGYARLAASIAKGYKLKNLPPLAIRNGQEIVLPAGNTRKEILSSYNQDVMPCAILKLTQPVTDWKIREICCYLSQSTNNPDPQTENTVADVTEQLFVLANIFLQSNGESGVDPNNLVELTKAAVVLGARFTANKQSQIAQKVYNERSTNGHSLVSWSSDSKKAKYYAANYMKRYGFIDNESSIYFCMSITTVSKIFTKALRLAFANPDKDIRIVLHTSTITSADEPLAAYERLVANATEELETLLNIGASVYAGTKKPNIKIYAILPAVQGPEAHDLEQPVMYSSKERVIYQRKNGYHCSLDTAIIDSTFHLDSMVHFDLDSEFRVQAESRPN